EPAAQQQIPERRAQSRGEHHHVEQHGGRHGHAEDGEDGPPSMTAQRRERERESHYRPSSVSGGVRTRRSAASAPAARPSTSESVTANSTMPVVMIEKRSGVS